MESIIDINIDELLGTPTDISGLDVSSCTRLSFELTKETGAIVMTAPHIFETNHEEVVLSYNQAIESGLLIRIGKFMASILALLADPVSNHGEVIIALNRCITESSINLKFFCENATQDDFDRFIKSGLKAEKELYEIIQINSSARGYMIPIEERMLRSIENTVRASNLNSINELNNIPRWIDYRTLLNSVHLESAYPMLQGVPSHAIHGTWPDILLHNLNIVENGFETKVESLIPDTRLLCPVNLIVLDSIQSYFRKYFPEPGTGISLLLERINNLIERNIRINNFHEESINTII